MHLLNTHTGQFEFYISQSNVRYAMLSHTWDAQGEQTYEYLRGIQDFSHVETILPPPSNPPTTLLPPDTPSLLCEPPTLLPHSQTPPSDCPTVHLPSKRRTRSGRWRRLAQLLASALLSSTAGRDQIDSSPAPSAPQVRHNPSSTAPATPESITPLNTSFTPPRAPTAILDDPRLSPKIREACRVAREDGYDYIWIYPCCIDKRSSFELSEAINSMYQWFARADICYAFLPDVPAEEDPNDQGSSFRRSFWFTRGWTLQELIAPGHVVFLARDWTEIGTKLSLGDLVAEVTKIDYDALLHIEPVDKFSVAQRLSWAADRLTTREEDRAYSLLGIFGINMPTLYGEGGEGAFRRLQEEIMRRTPDQSLFAWTRQGPLRDFSSDLHNPQVPYKDEGSGHFAFAQRSSSSLLARSLDDFSQCAGIEALSHDEVLRRLQLPAKALPTTDYDFTPYGIRLQLPVIPLSVVSSQYFPPEQCVVEQRPGMDIIPVSQWYLVILGCAHRDSGFPGHLLGRVCYTQSSGSTIESLYSGWIRGMGEVFLVTPKVITDIRSWHISQKTLYVPQPRRIEGAKHLATHLNPHETIKLVLSKKTQDALSAQGYAATVRAVPDAAHPNTHLVTLAHDTHTHTITIHYYQHTLAEHQSGQQWAIEAYVKSSRGPSIYQDAPGDLGVAQSRIDGHASTEVSWPDFLPWGEQIGTIHEVELTIPGHMKLTAQLGLAFATRNLYRIHIELRPSPHSAPVPHLTMSRPRMVRAPHRLPTPAS